jgi:prevent-host-death family protein
MVMTGSRKSKGSKSRRPVLLAPLPTLSHRRRLSAADFKATCLHLMDRVRETGVEYVVTKHGRPVARLVRVEGEASTGFFGSMRGTVLKYERPFDPVGGRYDVNQD